jgi:hypothetical protein
VSNGFTCEVQNSNSQAKSHLISHYFNKENQSIVLIDVWMIPFRDEMKNKAIKKTLTIPKWLDDIASQHKVNFSRVLQDALIQYLGVDGKDKRKL